MSTTLKSGQCVCQYCTCGRHHCRHQSARDRNVGECNFESTTRADYVPVAAPRTVSMKPQPRAVASDAPFEGSTTYGGDFDHKGFEPVQSTKKREVYVPPTERMEGVSTVKRDYPAHEPVQTQSCKPANQREAPPPGEFNTTYKSDLGDYRPASRAISFKPKPTLNKSDAPFEGSSVYAREYPRHEGVPRTESKKPVAVASRSLAPMAGRSVAHDAYTGEYVPPAKSCRPAANRSEPAPFEGATTKQLDFVQHPVERTPSMKPVQAARLSNDPFEGRSTAADEYKAWPMSKTKSMKPDQQVHRGGEFYGEPTHRADFKPLPIERTKSMKPVQEVKPREPGTYETTYGKDMVPQAAERTLPFKPANKPLQSGEFQGTTENRDSFIPRRATPTKSMRPTNEYRPSSRPFAHRSTTRDEFPEHELPCPCPRLFIPSQYVECDCSAAGIHPHQHARNCASRQHSARSSVSSSRTTTRASTRQQGGAYMRDMYTPSAGPARRSSGDVRRDVVEIGMTRT